MRLEDNNGNIRIWQTGSQKNKILFDSTEDFSEYRRKELARYELFLRKNEQEKLADEIKKFLGKIIRAVSVDDLLIPNGHYRTNTNLEYLKDVIKDYKENEGLNLNPNFQRAHVWSIEQRVAYVEFLLKGGKSNPIYFNHETWMVGFGGEFVIVDGKQRLTSLLMFLNNEFSVFKERDKEGIGFYAKEFDFIPNNIEIVINDLPTRELVLKWYLQMNEGNVAHTKEELDKVRNMLNRENNP